GREAHRSGVDVEARPAHAHTIPREWRVGVAERTGIRTPPAPLGCDPDLVEGLSAGSHAEIRTALRRVAKVQPDLDRTEQIERGSHEETAGGRRSSLFASGDRVELAERAH